MFNIAALVLINADCPQFRKYPTFVVEKKEIFSGWDRKKIEALIDKHIKAGK
jgi:hypothetical protein